MFVSFFFDVVRFLVRVFIVMGVMFAKNVTSFANLQISFEFNIRLVYKNF